MLRQSDTMIFDYNFRGWIWLVHGWGEFNESLRSIQQQKQNNKHNIDFYLTSPHPLALRRDGLVSFACPMCAFGLVGVETALVMAMDEDSVVVPGIDQTRTNISRTLHVHIMREC
jgi:hypothetical protein